MFTTIRVTVKENRYSQRAKVHKTADLDFSGIAHSKYPAADAAAHIIKRLVTQAHEQLEAALAEKAEAAEHAATGN